MDTNGNVFVGGWTGGTAFRCVRSSNAQIAGQTPTFDRNTAVNLGGGLLYPGAINPEGLAGQVFLAIDHSGGATNNNIYMLCQCAAGRAESTTDVMFVRSTDGGLTFSAPVKVNDDGLSTRTSGTGSGRFRWLRMDALMLYGMTPAIAANNTDSQLFYSYSTDAGVTWSPNVAVSNSFNPIEGYPNQNKIGDYITIVSDNTGGNVAYSATFNFNPSPWTT